MDINVNKKRHDFVDLLKAIAIIFVLFYHFSIMNIDFIHSEDLICYLNYYLKSLLSTCVPIFFFVNGGLLLNKSSLDIKRHVIKTIKILILTILWGIITLLILSLIRQENLSFIEIIKGVYFLKMGYINHLWFFQALFIIYIFYPLLFSTMKSSIKAFYFFTLAVFIFTFLNNFIGEFAKFISITFHVLEGKSFESINYFERFNPFNGFYGYSIGYFIFWGILFKYQNVLKTQKVKNASIAILPISMGLIFFYGVKVSHSYNEVWDIVWHGYDNIFTLINVILIFVISLHYKSRGVLGRLVNIIAENSLGIYLIHLIIGPLIRPFIPISSIFSNLFFIISCLFISLFLALGIKRIPVLKNLLSL